MDARKIFSEEELRAAYKRQNEETKRARWYAELKRSGAAM